MFKAKLRAAAISLVLILIVAFGVRILFAWNYARLNPHQALSVLPFLFESGNIAVSLATTHTFSSPLRVPTGPTAWTTPVYPLALACIFHVFGIYTFHSFLAAAALNIICVALTCIPIFYAGKRIAGVGVGAGAAWIFALFPNGVLIPVQSMWEACMATLLSAALLWATLALSESRRLRDWCAYGLLWGVTLMTNATMLSLLPFLLLWAAFRLRRLPESAEPSRAQAQGPAAMSAKSWLLRPALALVVAALCCVPWTVRNYVVFHAFVPLRSALGLQLWMGNSPYASVVWLGHGHPSVDSEERARYVEMGEIAYMREKKEMALGYMFTHPKREAELAWGRFIVIWSGGATHPIIDFLRAPTLWYRGTLLFNLLLAFGTLAGVVTLFWTHNPYAFPIAVFPLLYPWAYYLSLALPRYRLPVDPADAILAAAAIAMLLRSLRRKRVPTRAASPTSDLTPVA